VAIGKDAAVLRQLRTLFNVGTVRELTDGQLLEQFATDRGEVAELAFAVLVERHGPMVLRVCRGVLADAHDTQDAFQATFLVLVRKARALWVRDSLGPWLHQVAYRTATRARSEAARRHRHERLAARSEEAEVRSQPSDELEKTLHEEINRLPERYQAPVVLCDLEGCTHEQAARHLGWPVGTVKSRLSRGRERLRGRLLRRGLTADPGLIAAALTSDPSAATISSALVNSTAGAAARFLTVRTFVHGSTASLAQGVLRSMSIIQWLKAASVVLVASTTVAGVGVLAQSGTSGAQARPEEKPQAVASAETSSFQVKPGRLRITVVERGSLESSLNQDVYCRVEGQTTIIGIVPEGTRVKKGEVICELDSAALKDSLINQQIATESAKANYLNAKLAREVAEIALIEYTEGIYHQHLATVVGEIRLAESAIQKAESRLERTRRARQRFNDTLVPKGDAKTVAEILADLDLDDRIDDTEQTLSHARMTREQAENKRKVLTQYTKGKTIKELVSEVEKARSDELAKQATWSLERSKEKKLERQIAACTLTAPTEGLVVYANDPGRGFGRTQPQIEEGATVRERQKILSIPDITKMQVNAKVHESKIDMIIPNMKVKIGVDAFADLILDGTVLDVAPLPDPVNTFSPNIKVYTTHIRIDNPVAGLRPGMTAQAEIFIGQFDNVLSVPVQAVLRLDGKDQVAVQKPGGGFEWREVSLGRSNEKFVQVTQGIHSGESVILNPLSLLSDEEKREKLSTPFEPAKETNVPAKAKTDPRAKTPKRIP
jgi:HlyD family secretion protein